MRVNAAGNRRGMHWAVKRAQKAKRLLEQFDTENAATDTAEPDNKETKHDNAETNANPGGNMGVPDASATGQSDGHSQDTNPKTNDGDNLETYRLETAIPEVESPRDHIIAEENAEEETASENPPESSQKAPLSIDPVSVRIAVDTTSAVAAKIPPDKEKLSDDERALWSSIWEHTFQRLGYASLPLWLEWVAGITTSFIPRFVSWKNHKDKQQKETPSNGAHYETGTQKETDAEVPEKSNGFRAKIASLYDNLTSDE